MLYKIIYLGEGHQGPCGQDHLLVASVDDIQHDTVSTNQSAIVHKYLTEFLSFQFFVEPDFHVNQWFDTRYST